MKKNYSKPMMSVCKIEPATMLALSAEDGGNYGRPAPSVNNRQSGEWGNLWSNNNDSK